MTAMSLAGLLVVPATAPADPGGAGAGGMFASETPRPTSITCTTACAGLDSAAAGSVVRISGEALEQVATVVFLGAPGQDDDKVVAAIEPSPGGVSAQVPDGARSGPVLVTNTDGNTSQPTKASLAIAGAGQVAAQSGGIEARVDATKVFYAGRRHARLSYFVRSASSATVAGEIVRARDGKVLASFPAQTVPGRTVQSLEWSGLVGGRVPSDGKYLFRVHVTGAGGGSGAQAAQAEGGQAIIEQGFTFVRDMFPIRGRHVFGDGAAHFGASRGGGGHQGQDIFARCGTRLVAARGGVVKFAGFHERAGNYLVVDGDGTGQDHVYMHLKDAVTLKKGDRVFTGQEIGAVGDTGHADGCHLHFELWSSPGWYTGGSAVDPNPSLARWDRFS
jgi:murein DD-endopeptidase MepM/ murein hydrolase activator NlpD